MCERSQLNDVLFIVASEAKKILNDKLNSVMLFGSYARGDYDMESDIDIMILANIRTDEINLYTKKIREQIYRLEIEHDCVISLCVVPTDNYNRYKNVLPFYANVAKDGVQIAV